MNKRKEIEKKMAEKIAAVTLCSVEVVLLTAGKMYLSIEIEGNNTKAVERLRSFFGQAFDCSEYDAELNYTYAGIRLQ